MRMFMSLEWGWSMTKNLPFGWVDELLDGEIAGFKSVFKDCFQQLTRLVKTDVKHCWNKLLFCSYYGY
jgi:hypothetical protein